MVTGRAVVEASRTGLAAVVLMRLQVLLLGACLQV
jgi:hypothetical protein